MTDKYKTDVYAEDINISDTGPTVSVENIDRVDIAKYSGASGDYTSTHVSEPAAKKAGHKSVFAMGMFTAGFASHMISDWFGSDNIETFSCRFLSQVWPGDSITVSGEVTEKNKKEDGAHISVDFVAKNQNKNEVLSGHATALLPYKNK
jgi:acyl dehydratase